MRTGALGTSLPTTPLSGAFAERRVLVTGHTGFKGAWLCEWLLALGAEVAGLALEPATEPNLFDQLRLAERLDHAIGDIGDADLVARRVEAVRPDYLFHLAAQPLVRESYETPLETLQTNVMGTAHVLDAVRRSGRPCIVVVVTSDKCYENREDERLYTEEDALGGYDVYSASKGAAEVVTSAYRRAFLNPAEYASHGVAVASVRAGNVVGGGDWAADRLVPDIARALAKGEPVDVRNPASIRPWQHVLDALSGYLTIAERITREGAAGYAEAWNFGPGERDTTTVGELVERTLEVWGSGEARMAPQSGAPHEAGLLRLSSEKAEKRLGWRPAFSLDETVDATVRWYKMAADLAAGRGGAATIHEFTTEQIAEYTIRAREAGLPWAID